jgi:hypothetical protein
VTTKKKRKKITAREAERRRAARLGPGGEVLSALETAEQIRELHKSGFTVAPPVQDRP